MLSLSNREIIIAEIIKERDYQVDRWGGHQHDREHTINDWIAFISGYLGRAWVEPPDNSVFRKNLIKVAALVLAAIETLDEELHKEDEG